MFPGTSRAPLLHHVVSCTSLSLQLLGTQDFVDVVQAVFGWLCPVGVVGQGGIQATVLRGGEAGGGSRAVGVKQRGLVMVLLPVVQGSFGPFSGREGNTSCLDT